MLGTCFSPLKLFCLNHFWAEDTHLRMLKGISKVWGSVHCTDKWWMHVGG